MSNREIAAELLEQIPDYKLPQIIFFLQGAAIPDKVPNADTIEAMNEIDNMIKTGAGQHFEGSTEEFMRMMMED